MSGHAKAQTVALAALLAGVTGWTLENVGSDKPRYSSHLPGLPFLPVYAAGGAIVALLAPSLSDFHPFGKALVYAGALTALEASTGYAERTMGRKSWDYEGAPVDLPHALLWGGLGLALDSVLPSSSKGSQK